MVGYMLFGARSFAIKSLPINSHAISPPWIRHSGGLWGLSPPGLVKFMDFRGFSGPNRCWAPPPPPAKKKSLSPPLDKFLNTPLNQPNLLSASLSIPSFAFNSLALGLMHLRSGLTCSPVSLDNVNLLSGLTCYLNVCSSFSTVQTSYYLNTLLSKLVLFLKTLLSKPVLSCYHKLVAC